MGRRKRAAVLSIRAAVALEISPVAVGKGRVFLGRVRVLARRRRRREDGRTGRAVAVEGARVGWMDAGGAHGSVRVFLRGRTFLGRGRWDKVRFVEVK